MKHFVITLFVTLWVLPGIASAKFSSDISKFEEAVSTVGTTAIVMSQANAQLQTARDAVDAAKDAIDDAKTVITKSSDWLEKNGDSGSWPETAKQNHRDNILTQTPILLAAERTLAAAMAELITANATWESALASYEDAKAAVTDLAIQAVDAEQTQIELAQTKLDVERKLSRNLVLDLIAVCNDNIVEADPNKCDPYEDRVFSFPTLLDLRAQITD